MAFQRPVEAALDYEPCRYGRSKLLFRGPPADTTSPYIATLGDAVTFGRYVPEPWPERLSSLMGMETLNLGCPNAGVDTFNEDATILGMCAEAEACVIQIMGAHGISNRYFAVHPRRNDRFIFGSSTLSALYPELDLSDIHFVRHLLQTLNGIDPERFVSIVEEMRSAWVARMRTLIRRIDRPIILLLVRSAPLSDGHDPRGVEPLFVTPKMVDEVSGDVADCIEIVREDDADSPAKGMIFPEMERRAAAQMPSPLTHRRIAEELTPALTRLI